MVPFSFIFSFKFLIKIFIGMHLIRLIHLGITQILTSIGLCLSPNLGSFQLLSLQTPFLLSSWGTNDLFILSHKSVMLCSFACSIFFLFLRLRNFYWSTFKFYRDHPLWIFFLFQNFYFSVLYLLFGSFFIIFTSLLGTCFPSFYKCVYFYLMQVNSNNCFKDFKASDW